MWIGKGNHHWASSTHQALSWVLFTHCLSWASQQFQETPTIIAPLLTRKPRLNEIQELLQVSMAAKGRARLRPRAVWLRCTTSQPRAMLPHHTPQTLTKTEVGSAASWAPTATYPSPSPPQNVWSHPCSSLPSQQTPGCYSSISQSFHMVIKLNTHSVQDSAGHQGNRGKQMK